MNSLNSILIEGNLTAVPVSRVTPNGATVCCFSVASNREYKVNEVYEKEVSFFEVETWGKTAEVCARILEKGKGVRVVGRIKQDRWTGSDGKNYSKIKIIAEHIEFKPNFKKVDPVSEPASEALAEGEDGKN